MRINLRTAASALAVLAAAALALAPAAAAAAAVPEDTTPEIPVATVSVVAVKLATLPSRLSYTVGDAPDYTGATLELTMSDRSTRTETVAASWCTGFDSDTDGEKTVTVTYPGTNLSDSFTVRVNSKKVAEIVIQRMPDRLDYYVGDTVSIAGIRVRAIYEGGTSADVTEGVSLAATDTSVPGDSVPVTVYYYANSSRYQATFHIRVLAVTVDSVSIATYPVRNEFSDGEPADYSGLSLTVLYRNGDDVIERTVDDLSLMSFEGYDPYTLGVQTVTVSYEGLSDRFRVSVTLSDSHVHTPGPYEVIEQPTCVTDGVEISRCTVCGEEADRRSTGTAPHTWGDWLIISHATSASDGSMERVCSVCGEKSVAVIPALNKILRNGDYSAEIGGTDLFADGMTFEVTSVTAVVTAGEMEAFAAAAGSDGRVVEVVCLAFRDQTGPVELDKPLTYTFPVADPGDAASFAAVRAGERIPAVYDPEKRTVTFTMNGAGTVALAAYGAEAETSAPPQTEPPVTEPPESTAPETSSAPPETGSVTEPPDDTEAGPSQTADTSAAEPVTEPQERDPGGSGTAVKVVIIAVVLLVAGALVGALCYKRYVY